MKRLAGTLIAVGCALIAIKALGPLILRVPLVHGVRLRLTGKRTVDDRIAEFGQDARSRLAPSFKSAGVPYPPSAITLVAFKKEWLLDLYANGSDGKPRFVKSYPFTAASGKLGPKLRQGDLQVPEGVYRITFLNPNSAYHVSLRVDYPNPFDVANGTKDGRTNLGGDIMIHGKAASIGCIAIGDTAIEEVFTVSADVGIQNIECVISPVDLRVSELPQGLSVAHNWAPVLYSTISSKVQALPIR